MNSRTSINEKYSSTAPMAFWPADSSVNDGCIGLSFESTLDFHESGWICFSSIDSTSQMKIYRIEKDTSLTVLLENQRTRKRVRKTINEYAEIEIDRENGPGLAMLSMINSKFAEKYGLSCCFDSTGHLIIDAKDGLVYRLEPVLETLSQGAICFNISSARSGLSKSLGMYRLSSIPEKGKVRFDKLQTSDEPIERIVIVKGKTLTIVSRCN